MMALMKASSSKLTPSSVVSLKNEPVEKAITQPKKKILSEEEYTGKMEKIITRDFFPDLPKLKAQNDYLTALEKGDIAKIHEIQLAYQPVQSTRSRSSSIRGISSTPATFETPDVSQISSPFRNSSRETDSIDLENEEKKEMSLDQFLAQATSEDNASFQVIMEKSAKLHQQKYPWLYKDENAEQNKITNMLTLPSSEANIDAERKPELITWAYKNQNSLMYVPDGAEFTAEEKLAYENKKEILHVNTKFEAPPFDEQANKEAIAEAASVQAKMKEGKVGIDGKEIIPGDSPQVNGYGFVGTPLPEPGVTDTPIMTWGEIEGTPFRLDGSDTPLPQNPSGQQFKIPNLSAREKIALSLADKAAKKHRKKVPSGLLSPVINFGSSSPMTPMEKLQNMSPAARKLACAKLGIQRDTDKALRASYSPSPSLRASYSPSPSLRASYSPSPLLTPNNNRTPVLLHTPSAPAASTTTVITPSHADTMLNLPKRQKASDFF